jgi:hypothetical protein
VLLAGEQEIADGTVLAVQHLDHGPSSSAEFKVRIIADVDKWTGVIAPANIECI